jgi:hypothetical protein
MCAKAAELQTNARNYCTEEDELLLGPNGGLRCVTIPDEVVIPLTKAKKCEGFVKDLADISGFRVSFSELIN